jgi:hypothetical protein
MTIAPITNRSLGAPPVLEASRRGSTIHAIPIPTTYSPIIGAATTI